MTNRENVIKRLEECLSASCRGFRTCPYSDDPEWDAVEAALALLREQEPRVMTLEEVRDEAEYMFLEKRSSTWSDLFGCAIRGDWNWYGMDLLLGEDDYIRGMWENYGKTWRCWTARPTDEQRKTVKWDD